MTETEGRVLVAVLLNPPTGDGARTRAHLRVAANCLGCDAVRIVNLFATPTRDLAALSMVAHHSQDWTARRAVIAAAIREGDEVLLGWGVSFPTGPARTRLDEQIKWLVAELDAIEVVAWVVGDGPRHPSRWHQYVSDRHNRTDGGPFADRVRYSLVRYRIEHRPLVSAEAEPNHNPPPSGNMPEPPASRFTGVLRPVGPQVPQGEQHSDAIRRLKSASEAG